MAGHMVSVTMREIEDAVYQLVAQHRRVTFTLLSSALPQCRWQTLFQVLHDLQEKGLVVLAPLPWDYEIRAEDANARIDGRTR
ncbi:MAG: hypothetical protein Q7U76_12205 [Nitrospirota bacterium]|jgi:DNA-binding HxlR family transcriptional regulator|nr:hypothetical protein [Nitrospirota bacterium]